MINLDKTSRPLGSVDSKTYRNTEDFKASYTFTGLTPGIMVTLVDKLSGTLENKRWKANASRTAKVDAYGHVSFTELNDSVYSLIVNDAEYSKESIHNVMIGDPRKISRYELPIIMVSLHGITGNLASSDQATFEALLSTYSNKQILVDVPVKISTNLTIPETANLSFIGDGNLYIASGMKIKFEDGCSFNDADYCIFNFESDIKVEGVINQDYWRPEWFGAYPDDTSANFAHVINEMYDHRMSEAATTGWYPSVFRFKQGRTYYTTDPVKYRSLRPTPAAYVSGLTNEDADIVYVYDTSALPSAGIVYAWTDIDRWVGLTYTSKTATSISGCVWSVYHGLSDDEATIQDGAGIHRRVSQMNDFVMESPMGPRWGGAILRSAIPESGVANAYGGKVIDAGHATAGYIPTRCVFRGLQFKGHGTEGQLQHEYVCDFSALDLMHVDTCGFFYCNRGIYMRDAGAGAAIVTNSYLVNSDSYDTCMVNGMGNCKFDTCIIENSNLIVAGNSTDPCTFTNCHIEKVTIDVESNRIVISPSTGTTNSTSITLRPEVCHSYVTIREVGSYVHDHGHYNHIDAGYRYEECEGITSSVVQMAYPASRENGRMILNSGVPWLLSLGISKDGATDASYDDYNFRLYDVSTTSNVDPVVSGTVFKDYGTIEVGGNTSRFIPIWYEQHWDCVIPSGNIMLAASHACNLRATRPINRTPLLRYEDVTLDGTKQNIPGWYGESAIYNTSSGIGVYMTSGVDGKIRIRTESIPEVQYITLSYTQLLPLEMGKTYVAIMQGTLNSGTVLPELTLGSTATYSNQEYHSITPIEISSGIYQAIGLFRPRTNAPTKIAFGHLITPGVMDFTFDFIAVAELGDYTKYISDGIPECGVFYKNDVIYEENPQVNLNSRYICRGSVNTSDYYGLKDPGAACSKGTWVPSGVYLQGEWWAYGSRVFCARYSHSGLTELPTYSGSATWKAIERSDADYSDPSYLAVPNGSGVFTTIGPNVSLDHGSMEGLGDDDHPQYVLADGTRAFSGTVSGVTPTADAHLATKLYVDDHSVINVDDFGADPTGATDSSDAIQDAIDSATGGGIIYFGLGKDSSAYGIAKTIRLKNDITLQGAGHFNTHIFALSGFYTNTGATYLSATSGDNILDDGGWPVLISATGGSSTHPLHSHIQIKDLALYPRVYSEWSALANSDKMHDSTGIYGMFYELEIHNVGSHGFRRCFNIGINNGTMGGAGISYYGEIGLRVLNAIGFVCHGHSLVGHTVGVDIDNCSDGSFKIHQETSSIGYRIGPSVYNTKINLGSLFNVESQPFVIHPSAKVIIEGFPANSLMSHNFPGEIHQTEVQPAVNNEYGFINYVPDGDMSENKLTPTYWTYSGGGASAEISKRRALRKYDGTASSLNNYDGKPKLWCYPGGVAGDETTFEVYSSGIEHLGFLDVRFSTLDSIGVRLQITDSGDSNAILYDSGLISGMAVASNSRPFGETVIAGDLREKEYAATGPFVLRITTDSPDGFVISRAMMYKSMTALNTDLGPHSVLASGVQIADATSISSYTSDLSDFPNIGRLSVLDTNNQWLTISYSGVSSNSFTNCVWSRRFTDLAVNNIADSGVIYRYYDANEDSHQGFEAYNFRSGPVGGDNQSMRVIVGTSLTEDVPHRVVGWVKSLGNSALIGNEHAVLQVYDTTPAGPDRHNQTWIPNSGITHLDYEDGWTFIDMEASTSYYAYLEKRAADIAFAGVGLIKPTAKLNGKFYFSSVPTEGWWRVGDEILVGGVPYHCTAAGDPGTWATASGGSSSSTGTSYFPGGW